MPSFLIRFSTVAVALLTVPITGGAQGVAPRAQPVTPPGYQPGAVYPQERMSVVDPDKKLSAGDQVTVEIVEDREGGLPRVVTATGELDVPPLGRVKVSGKTAYEAAASIKTQLEREYYFAATVRISIDRLSPVNVRSGVVQIDGQVRAVGQLDIVAGETLTVTGAIGKAGGLTTFAKKNEVLLMRQVGGRTETIKVNYKKVVETGDVKNDPVLQDGDRIYVPRAPFVL